MPATLPLSLLEITAQKLVSNWELPAGSGQLARPGWRDISNVLGLTRHVPSRVIDARRSQVYAGENLIRFLSNISGSHPSRTSRRRLRRPFARIRHQLRSIRHSLTLRPAARSFVQLALTQHKEQSNSRREFPIWITPESIFTIMALAHCTPAIIPIYRKLKVDICATCYYSI